MTATILPYGAILMSLVVPDGKGNLIDVVLGYDTPKEYSHNPACFGATIGRYANRIGNGVFRLAGKSYSLARNEGNHHLHGGKRGFDQVPWIVDVLPTKNDQRIRLLYQSKAGEEGYPGNATCAVTYSVTDLGGLTIEYWAETDHATPISLTNHSFFNLAGNRQGSISDQHIAVPANVFLDTDEDKIPTGKLLPVNGTILDLRRPTHLGSLLEQLPEGLDHGYVLPVSQGSLRLAGEAFSPITGLTMEVFTTYPTVHVYTANHLDGSTPGKAGVRYPAHAAYCFETQNYSDAPNHPEFPSAILYPHQEYNHRTVFQFRTAS